MIEDDAIAIAIAQRLMTIDPARDVAWPGMNLPADAARPYLIFDHVPVARRDNTLKGTNEVATGFVMVTVISEPGLPIWSAMVENVAGDLVPSCGAIAKAVRTLFPYTERLTTADGDAVSIARSPEVMQGYPDGTHWRTPVKVVYETS